MVTDGTCTFNFRMSATGFTPSAIDWPYGTLYDNKTTATFKFPVPTDFTYTSTITVVATAPDGRTATDSISVDVIAPPPSGFSC